MRANALPYALTSARSHLRYGANLAGYVFVTAVTYLIRFVFLDRIVELAGGEVAGWSREQVVDLYVAGMLLALLSWAFAASANEFFRHVHLGRIDPHLMRPVGLPQLILLRWVNTPNLALAVLVIPAVAVDRWDRFAAAGAVGSTAFVAAVVLGVVSVVATMLAFHALTFVLQRPVPVDYVFSELFRFTQVPAPAFRGAAALSMVLALPIVLGVWAPVAALQATSTCSPRWPDLPPPSSA